MSRFIPILFLIFGVTISTAQDTNATKSKPILRLFSKRSSGEQDLEVTPPVNGGTCEVANPAKVSKRQGVISAASAQDAANAAVGQLRETTGSGVSTIEVGSGLGFVACGQASFNSEMSNPNAVRVAKRLATLRAYADAVTRLGEFLEGGELDADEFIGQYTDNIDTSEMSLLNSQISQEAKLEMAVEAYAAAYVLYDVTYQKNDVFVSVIVTPKTVQGVRSHNTNKVTLNQAENAAIGVELVKDSIANMCENNVIFPVGGKQIYISKTKEFAFLGFASQPIRTDKNWPEIQKRRQKTLALNTARNEANASLLSTLQGKPVVSNFSTSNDSDDSFSQFQDDEESEGVNIFDGAQEEFYARQKTNQEFQSALSGKFPSGVLNELFFFDDNDDGTDDWAFAIVYYVPSASAQALQVGKQIDNALNPPERKKPQLQKPVGQLPSGKPTKNSDL